MRSGQLRYALRKFREREGGANAKAPLLELLGLVFYFYFDFFPVCFYHCVLPCLNFLMKSECVGNYFHLDVISLLPLRVL